MHNGAAVVIDNASGDVIALVGSADYFSPGSGQVNGAWAKRSAGSTLKPFTYLLALERGATPATMVADVRTSFRDGGRFLSARELQPALLWTGDLSDRARQFAKYSSGQGAARCRRSGGAARTSAHLWPNDTRPSGRNLWSRPDPGKLRGAFVRIDQRLRESGAPGGISALARAPRCAFACAPLCATGACLADR